MTDPLAGFDTQRIRAEFTVPESDASYRMPRRTCKWCRHTLNDNVTRLRLHLQKCTMFNPRQGSRQGTLIPHIITRKAPPSFQQEGLMMAVEAVFTMGLSSSLWESKKMRELAQILNPLWKPPSRDVVFDQLPTVYFKYQQKVLDIVNGASLINIIIDGSDDSANNRLINVSIHIPGTAVFYWRSVDTRAEDHSATNTVALIKPVIFDLVGNNTLKINSVVTDTNSTMRKFHREMQARPEFAHIFYTLCDSHALQLLVKDISNIPVWKRVFSQVSLIIAFFKNSKLQLARLRTHQQRLYHAKRAFISSVIMRWGTQLSALRSISWNMEALKAWSNDPDTIRQASQGVGRHHRDNEQGGKQISQICRWVQDHTFWYSVETLTMILEPIHNAQKKSESDSNNVGHTIASWESIKELWRQSSQSPRWLSLGWQDLFGLLENRMKTQTLDIHYIAWALDPITTSLKLSREELSRVEAFLKQNCTDNAWPSVRTNFHQFRQREGPVFGATGLKDIYNPNFRPRDVWISLDNIDLPLAKIAKRVFSSLASSVPSERSFSTTNFIYTKARNRLPVESTDMAAFIYLNYRVFERLESAKTGQNEAVADRWETVGQAVLMEMEDDYQALLFEDGSDLQDLGLDDAIESLFGESF